MLTEVRDTLLALYERRNDFNADNQIVVDGYTNFVFRDLYGRVYSNHRINRQLKRITRGKSPFPDHMSYVTAYIIVGHRRCGRFDGYVII